MNISKPGYESNETVDEKKLKLAQKYLLEINHFRAQKFIKIAELKAFRKVRNDLPNAQAVEQYLNNTNEELIADIQQNPSNLSQSLRRLGQGIAFIDDPLGEELFLIYFSQFVLTEGINYNFNLYCMENYSKTIEKVLCQDSIAQVRLLYLLLGLIMNDHNSQHEVSDMLLKEIFIRIKRQGISSDQLGIPPELVFMKDDPNSRLWERFEKMSNENAFETVKRIDRRVYQKMIDQMPRFDQSPINIIRPLDASKNEELIELSDSVNQNGCEIIDKIIGEKSFLDITKKPQLGLIEEIRHLYRKILYRIK